MATDPAARPPRRHIWQLPTFAAGVAAAAAAWAAFPPAAADPACRFADDLTTLRQALDRKPVDLPTVERLAPTVAAAADQFPDQAATAHLLAGSAYLTLAETEPSESERWLLAARHLNQVDPAKLPDAADRKRLEYRKAKAQAARGDGDPRAIAAALSKPPPGEELDGERRRLLADTYLRPQGQDLRKAQAELKGYLSGPTRMPPAVLARYKLRLGTVYKTLGEPDQARTWLKEIGPAAPPDVQAEARVLLAGLADEERNWAEAVPLYQAALANPALPPDQRGEVRYKAGLALIQLGNTAAAVPYLDQAMKDPGPVAAAAAARLAELALADPTGKGARGKAVDLLTEAVRDASAGSEYRNVYLPVEQLRAAFEQAITLCLAEGDFPTAVRAAGVYMKVAAAGRGRSRRAEANAAWAQTLRQAGAAAKDVEARFREAAEDYLVLAENDPSAPDTADLLRRAADAFRKAGDNRAALTLIDRLTRTAGLSPPAAAVALVDKGELLLAAGQVAEGVAALQQAADLPGPSSKVAKARLGVAYVEQGKAQTRSADPAAQAAGQKMIEHGQNLLGQVANSPADAPAEKEAQQQALYELGKLLLHQQNYKDAEARFRQLVQAHKGSPLDGQAKLYLGSCLLLLARGDDRGGQPPADSDRKLDEARRLFDELARSPDPFLSTHADIRLANTTLLLKKYDDMPELCDRLAVKYRGRVEELIVLSMLYHAHANADRPEKAAAVLIQMEGVFGKLTDADFAGGAEEYTRDYWKKWFESVRK